MAQAIVARELEIEMTEDQRAVIEPYLFAGEEIEIIGTGGTRGCGKTFTGAHCLGYRRMMFPYSRGIAMRTVLEAADLNMGEELKSVFFRAHGFPVGIGKKQIRYRSDIGRFTFPNGSILQMGFCKNPRDWEKHLGVQWDDIWLEQAEQFPESVMNRMSGSNRPNNPDCIPRRLLTFNPGGIGQDWIERRVINPETRDRRLLWVKADIRRCPATLQRDPGYILRNLNSITDPVLRKQWLEGDWDAQSGLFFKLNSGTGDSPPTIRKVKVPYWADWYAGVDWGETRPFAVVWVAFWKEPDGKQKVHVAGEFYRSGLMLDDQARLAIEREKLLKRDYPLMHEIEYRLADPSTGNFRERESTEQTQSKASVWRKHGFDTRPSIRYNRSSGWQLIKYLIKRNALSIDPDCMALIKEFKNAVRLGAFDDIDQNRCHDHALDALRYIICALFGIDYAEEPTEEELWQLARRV